MCRSFFYCKPKAEKISLLDLSVALVGCVIPFHYAVMNMELVFQLLLPLIKPILTLKAPITTAADDKFYDIFISFIQK